MLAELDVRNNPVAQRPALLDTILTDVPNLEVFNCKEIVEPGFRYRVENEKIKENIMRLDKQAEQDQQLEGILEQAFKNVVDENGEQMNMAKVDEKFAETEANLLKSEAELVKNQLNISCKLVPLTRSSLIEEGHMELNITDFSKEELIKESIEFRKKTKDDFSKIRSDFRLVVNELRFKEIDMFTRIGSKVGERGTQSERGTTERGNNDGKIF